MMMILMVMNYDLAISAFVKSSTLLTKRIFRKQMIILSTGQIAKDQEQHQRDVWTEFLGFLKQRAAKQVSNYYVAAYNDDGDHMMLMIIW